MAFNFSTPYSTRIGILGSGTMGSGIALSVLYANMVVSLYDVSEEMLSKARDYIQTHLARKGREIALRNLTLTTQLEEMRGAGVVIEAVPENLILKKELFSRLDQICPPPAILATNTSTLAVTAIAAATAHPERVAGMHFFNPAPVMTLVEVVRGAHSSPDTLQSLVNLAERLGKTPVVTGDTPGFIVNRVARPFYGESLRLLGEKAADHESIDRLVRLGAGFRMGPFQLMDLIGIDINAAAMESMWQQTFGESRYRPHPIQIQKVYSGDLGKKTGKGFYLYTKKGPVEEIESPHPQHSRGTIDLVTGERETWAAGLTHLFTGAGFTLAQGSQPVAGIAALSRADGLADRLSELDRRIPAGRPILIECSAVTLAEAAGWVTHPERIVGFDGLFLSGGRAVEMVSTPGLTTGEARSQCEGLMRSLGQLPVWVADTPGLVLPRILSMLANEAAFAVEAGVASDVDIDQAMKLGANYPTGPLEWARSIGYEQVFAILQHLQTEYGEERYRAAYTLRQRARLASLLPDKNQLSVYSGKTG